jgi:hypothetical protein
VHGWAFLLLPFLAERMDTFREELFLEEEMNLAGWLAKFEMNYERPACDARQVGR